MVHKRTRKMIECSLSETARILDKTPKTIGTWRKKAELKEPLHYKEYGRYEIYFDREVIKQDKFKNLN